MITLETYSRGFEDLPEDVLEFLKTNGPLVESEDRIACSRTYEIPGARFSVDVFLIKTREAGFLVKEVTTWLRNLAKPPLDQMELAK